MAEAKRARDFCDNYPGGPEKLDELLELTHELRTQGIDPYELLNFGIMVRKNKRDPLTDDQNLKAHELLLQKVPGEEIYQRIFGGAA